MSPAEDPGAQPQTQDKPAKPVADESELQLYTAAQAAVVLQVSPSWLRKKASARVVPCTFIGRHLRFSAADLTAIVQEGARSATRSIGTSSRIDRLDPATVRHVHGA
jgi:excisionase family DNA binding protein